MVDGVKADIAYTITGRYRGPADLGEVGSQLDPIVERITLIPGSADIGRSDVLYAETRSIAAGGEDIVDLSGVLRDHWDNLIALEELVLLYIAADAGNDQDLLVGGGSFQGPLSAGSVMPLRPGEDIALPSARGWHVSPGTQDQLKIVNNGAELASYDLIFMGRSSGIPGLQISGVIGDGTEGTPFSFVPSTSGGSGTKVFTQSGTLPNGITFNAATGALNGTPSQSGSFPNIFITVTDASGSATLGPLTIAIEEAVVLGTLTLSGVLEVGTETSGTILGATPGSDIVDNIPGITINSADRTYAGTPTGSAGNIPNGLVETLDGAIGSPKSSAVTVTAVLTYAALNLANTSATPGVGWSSTFTGKTSGSTVTATSSDGTPLTVVGSTVSGTFSAQGNPIISLHETGLAGYTDRDTATTVNVIATATANALLLAALQPFPFTGEGPGSRERQNYIERTSAGGVTSSSVGQMSWWQSLKRRCRSHVFYDATKDMGLGGMSFALDGNGFPYLWQQIPRIIAAFKGGKGFFIVGLSSNSVQFTNYDVYGNDLGTTFSVAGYTNVAKQCINALIAGGVPVAVKNLWERIDTTGGPWGAGQAPRLLVPEINAEMQSYCAANNIPYIDARSTMVDLTGTLHNPKAGYTRDGTHNSTIGGYEMSLLYEAGMGPYLPTIDVPSTTGNLVPALHDAAGTGGTLTGTFAGGSVAADGINITRTGATSASAVTARKVTPSGMNWQELEFNTAGMASGNREGVIVTPVTAVGLTVGQWYSGTVRVQVDAWDAWLGPPSFAVSGGSGVALAQVTASESVVLTPEGTGGLGPMVGPSAAYEVTLDVEPFQATAATATFSMRMYYGKSAGSGTGKIRFRELRVVPETDPRALMYDPATTGVAAAVTSPVALSCPEEENYLFRLTANQPGTFTFGGGDASSFISRKGTVARADAWGDVTFQAKDFEAPSQSGPTPNQYTTTYTFTPLNPNNSAITGTLTMNVTDIADGTLYNFNGTDGTDLADWNTSIERMGTTGAIIISSNRARNTLSVPVTAYRFPQEGDTPRQEVRWASTSAVSANMVVCVRLTDQNNFIGLAAQSGTYVVRRRNAGTDSNLSAALVPYATILSSDKWIMSIGSDDMVRVYQNGVLLKDANGASAWDVSQILPNEKRAGLVSNTGSGSNNGIDNFNIRPSAPIVSKVGLRGLSPTTAAGAAGAFFELALNNVEPGTSISATGGGGAFYTDAGFTLKSNALPSGASSVVVTQTHPNAVNSGRQTTITVTGS